MKKVWSWIVAAAKATWKWFRENPIALAAALGTALGAFLVYKSSRNRIRRLEDAVEVEANRKRIAAATATAKTLEKQAAEKEPEIRRLEAEVARAKRRVVEINEESEDVYTMSDDEVARRFSEAGF